MFKHNTFKIGSGTIHGIEIALGKHIFRVCFGINHIRKVDPFKQAHKAFHAMPEKEQQRIKELFKRNTEE